MKKWNKLWLVLLVLALVGLISLGIGLSLWNTKVETPEEKAYLYIHPNSNMDDLLRNMDSIEIYYNSLAFKLYKNLYKFNSPRSGRYEIEDNAKLRHIVRKLSRKEQSPINIIIGKSRTKEEFSEKIAQSLAFSSEEILEILNNKEVLKDLGLDIENSLSIVIPNTYEVFWDISPMGFYNRMKTESDRFWKDRDKQLQESKLSKKEVIILASIIEEETNKNDEKSRMAGVYINRLRIGMPLQADPTIRFAINDFGIKRILNNMLKVDSPYNTYINTGLPPGPICIPSIASIDAVLRAEQHSYMYFCAKDDFSGYHIFAETYNEHLANARKYRIALSKLMGNKNG